MEWASVEEMESDVRRVVENGRSVCYGSCCQELQIQQQQSQHALINKLEKYREQAVESQDERQAKAAFINLNIAAALLYHLQLLVLLKSDRTVEAWDQLVEAQESLQCARQFVQDDCLRRWHEELLTIETLLFPPQIFVSSSHTFSSAECTICDSEYGECEHVSGRLYMGQMCGLRVGNIGNVDHVAFVVHPRDKGCRATKVKRDGYMCCTLTLRQLEKANADPGDFEICILRAR